MALDLPDFPWDALAPFAEKARSHPSGIVDLSVGSPVDPTPGVARAALAAAADAPGYPSTAGTAKLRRAIIDWHARRRNVFGLHDRNVLPLVGSKEFIAGLALWLGLGPDDTVVQPSVAYPTYAVGARLAGAKLFTGDDPRSWPDDTKLIWLNSPGNPDGRVLGIDQLRDAVRRARELGAVIVNDECYAELGWGPEPSTPCILDDRVIEGSRTNILAVYSLSKQSNLAGYRAAFAAGCGGVLERLLTVRKHLGLNPPAPIQAAMAAVLGDDAHVAEQRERYRRRREVLIGALTGAGLRIDHSDAGLYLWAGDGSNAWELVQRFADLGILVTPGTFYGDDRHVRIAVTATDDAVGDAAERLAASVR